MNMVVSIFILFLFCLSAVAQEQAVPPAVRPEQQGDAADDAFKEGATQVKVLQGRVDSLRPDKIVVTCRPPEQAGVELQIYFVRDKNTRFLRRREEKIEPGDVVEVIYGESRWLDARGCRQIERVAQVVNFIHTREVEAMGIRRRR